MKLREYAAKNPGAYVSEVQLYAGDFLERHGDVFLMNFNLENVVDKAAEMFCIFLDEDNWPGRFAYDGWS